MKRRHPSNELETEPPERSGVLDPAVRGRLVGPRESADVARIAGVQAGEDISCPTLALGGERDGIGADRQALDPAKDRIGASARDRFDERVAVTAARAATVAYDERP